MLPSPRGHRRPTVIFAAAALLATCTVAPGPALAWLTAVQVRPAPAVDAGLVMPVQATSQSEMSEIREALGQMRQEMQEMREAVRAAREASERAADAAERAADAAEASADAARQAAEGR